jgi:hypothetical protein
MFEYFFGFATHTSPEHYATDLGEFVFEGKISMPGTMQGAVRYFTLKAYLL